MGFSDLRAGCAGCAVGGGGRYTSCPAGPCPIERTGSSATVYSLTRSDYLQNITVQAGNSGLIVGTPGDLRMFGITLRAKA